MSASILEQEINEQPAAIQRLLDNETEHVQRLADSLRGRFDYILIAARGTSDNAARYAQYAFGVYNRVPIALASPSLFTLYDRPPLLNGALVVGISQSGQSPDIGAVITEARRQGRPTLAITNDPASPLAQAAEEVISLHAGPERAIAATKTYTTSLAALALLSAALAADEERYAQLQQLPQLMSQTLTGLAPLMARAERYRYMGHCVVIGRGYNFATAFEIALKIKELTRIVAEPYSSADFRHGPIAMVGQGFPTLVVAPTDTVTDDLQTLVHDLKNLGAELLLISEDATLLGQAQLPLPLPPHIPTWLTPLVAVLPGQCFSLALAQAKGLNPDQPVGLKKVTETL
ncbi:MAG: SIS domain-containing protein [Anaerolineales bacterium]|nr:SIS domain-containing protein [Anaerolineales bacterium]